MVIALETCRPASDRVSAARIKEVVLRAEAAQVIPCFWSDELFVAGPR
jgi:hypothetical protein